MQAKQGWSVSMRSMIWPPSATRTHSAAAALATQMAPSASRQMPSGRRRGSSAHTLRFDSVPSAAMSKAVSRDPIVSATTRVRSSGVMTVPLGKARSVAAHCTVPSDWTSARSAERIIAGSRASTKACRSKPKLPTYARPTASTTMSLQWKVATPDRSACGSSRPPVKRSSCRSSIDTTTRSPSGSQPSPLDCPSTCTRTVTRPSRSTDFTAWSYMSLNHSSPACQRGPSPKQSPVASTS